MAQSSKLSSFFLLLLTFFAAGLATPIQPENGLFEREDYAVNFDQMFDRFLPLIQKAILNNGMDPQELPDFAETVIPLPGKLRRDIEFSQGWLQEMSTLTRSGPILIDYEEKIMNLDLNLHWDLLDFNYRYFFKALFISHSGDVYGRFHELDANVRMTVDLETQFVTLNSLKFTKVGNLDLKFEGSTGDGIKNIIAKLTTIIFPDTVLGIAEEKSFMIFQMVLEEMGNKLPVVFPGLRL